MEKESHEYKPVSMDSEDGLFAIHTSGTTGEPIGVVHTQAGYLLYAVMLHKVILLYTRCVLVISEVTASCLMHAHTLCLWIVMISVTYMYITLVHAYIDLRRRHTYKNIWKHAVWRVTCSIIYFNTQCPQFYGWEFATILMLFLICSMCLTTKKVTYLHVYLTWGGCLDTQVWYTVLSAMEPLQSSLKALQPILTKARD